MLKGIRFMAELAGLSVVICLAIYGFYGVFSDRQDTLVVEFGDAMGIMIAYLFGRISGIMWGDRNDG